MRTATLISFVVLWIFTTTLAIDGTSQQNKLSSLRSYLDVHINKIRMKRQVHNSTNKEATPTGPIAMNKRNPTEDIHSPPSTTDNQSEAAATTQISKEITKMREENRLLNVQIAVLASRNTDLEVMNDQLQKQYTDILGELKRRRIDFSKELSQHREVISLLGSRIALNREIRAYWKKIKGDESASVPENQTTPQP